MPLRYEVDSVNERHLIDFTHGRETLLDFVDTALAQRNHSLFTCSPFDLGSRAAIDDHFSDTIRQVKQFTNRCTAMIAGAGTFQATSTFANRYVYPIFRLQAGFAQFIGSIFFGLLAIGTNDADKALGEDAIQCGDEVVRFDAHVDKAADDVGNVIGMDGGENQVSCERGLNGDLGGFLVADFAHHDLVRVVAQNGAQSSGKGEPLLFVHGNLCDTAQLIFDGIFDGDDFVFVGLDFVDSRVKSGRFSRTRRTGDKNHSVRFADIAA